METLRHATEEIEKYNSVVDQFEFRKKLYYRYQGKEFDLKTLDAIVGRGGLLKAYRGWNLYS